MKTKKKIDGPKKVCVFRAPRGKKKSVTVVVGLNTFGKQNLFPSNKKKNKKTKQNFVLQTLT